ADGSPTTRESTPRLSMALHSERRFPISISRIPTVPIALLIPALGWAVQQGGAVGVRCLLPVPAIEVPGHGGPLRAEIGTWGATTVLRTMSLNSCSSIS